MGHHGRWVDPFQAELFERQAAQEGRSETSGVDGGANIMAKAGQGQLKRAGAAANTVFALDHQHGFSGLGQGDRGCQPVRAGAYDYRIIL